MARDPAYPLDRLPRKSSRRSRLIYTRRKKNSLPNQRNPPISNPSTRLDITSRHATNPTVRPKTTTEMIYQYCVFTLLGFITGAGILTLISNAKVRRGFLLFDSILTSLLWVGYAAYSIFQNRGQFSTGNEGRSFNLEIWRIVGEGLYLILAILATTFLVAGLVVTSGNRSRLILAAFLKHQKSMAILRLALLIVGVTVTVLWNIEAHTVGVAFISAYFAPFAFGPLTLSAIMLLLDRKAKKDFGFLNENVSSIST